MRREQPVPREDVPAAALGTASPTFMRASRAFVGSSTLEARSPRTAQRTAGSDVDTDDSSEEGGSSTAASTLEDVGPYRNGDFTPPKRAPSTPKKSLFQRIFASPRLAQIESDTAPKDGKARRKRLISAQSPEGKWPRTWAEYDTLYARGRIDVNDPPPPPPASTWTGEGPPPNERQVYQAPKPVDERARQMRMDLWGRNDRPRSASSSPRLSRSRPVTPNVTFDVSVPIPPESVFDRKPAAEGFSDTLEDHAAFQRIVTFARQTFGTGASVLTIFDGEEQRFLAESGLSGPRAMPREISFCSNTILAQKSGFCLLDTKKDWRFAGSTWVTDHGTRFYAGAPILASEVFDGSEDPQPLGTLCVCDSKPRGAFTEAERRQLAILAEMARREIGAWHAARMKAKLAAMDAEFGEFKVARRPSGGSTMHTGTLSIRGDESEYAVSLYTAPEGPTPPGSRRPSVEPERQAACDDAVRALAKQVNLDLTYLLEIDTTAKPTVEPRVVSARGLPDAHADGTPAFHFDRNLHLSALRAPEKGLLYQNPHADELPDGDPLLEVPEYSSAILVPVLDDPASQRGFVLAGYVIDRKRVFGLEDLGFFQAIAAELQKALTPA